MDKSNKLKNLNLTYKKKTIKNIRMSVIYLLLSTIIIFMVNSCTEKSSGYTYSMNLIQNEELEPYCISVALDVSGSLTLQQTRLRNMAVQLMCDVLPENSEVAGVFFSGKEENIDGTFAGSAIHKEQSRLNLSIENNRDVVKNFFSQDYVDISTLGRGTDISEALKAAFNNVSDDSLNKNKAIFIFTDGIFTPALTEKDKEENGRYWVLREYIEKSRTGGYNGSPIPIYVILLKNPNIPNAPQLLSEYFMIENEDGSQENAQIIDVSQMNNINWAHDEKTKIFTVNPGDNSMASVFSKIFYGLSNMKNAPLTGGNDGIFSFYVPDLNVDFLQITLYSQVSKDPVNITEIVYVDSDQKIELTEDVEIIQGDGYSIIKITDTEKIKYGNWHVKTDAGNGYYTIHSGVNGIIYFETEKETDIMCKDDLSVFFSFTDKNRQIFSSRNNPIISLQIKDSDGNEIEYMPLKKHNGTFVSDTHLNIEKGGNYEYNLSVKYDEFEYLFNNFIEIKDSPPELKINKFIGKLKIVPASLTDSFTINISEIIDDREDKSINDFIKFEMSADEQILPYDDEGNIYFDEKFIGQRTDYKLSVIDSGDNEHEYTLAITLIPFNYIWKILIIAGIIAAFIIIIKLLKKAYKEINRKNKETKRIKEQERQKNEARQVNIAKRIKERTEEINRVKNSNRDYDILFLNVETKEGKVHNYLYMSKYKNDASAKKALLKFGNIRYQESDLPIIEETDNDALPPVFDEVFKNIEIWLDSEQSNLKILSSDTIFTIKDIHDTNTKVAEVLENSYKCVYKLSCNKEYQLTVSSCKINFIVVDEPYYM